MARCGKKSEARGVCKGLERKTGYETYRLETVAKTIGDANSFQIPPYDSNGFIGPKPDPDFKLVIYLNRISLQALELQIVEVIGKLAVNPISVRSVEMKEMRSAES